MLREGVFHEFKILFLLQNIHYKYIDSLCEHIRIESPLLMCSGTRITQQLLYIIVIYK